MPYWSSEDHVIRFRMPDWSPEDHVVKFRTPDWSPEDHVTWFNMPDWPPEDHVTWFRTPDWFSGILSVIFLLSKPVVRLDGHERNHAIFPSRPIFKGTVASYSNI